MSLAIFIKMTGYFLLWLVALAGAVVSEILPKSTDEDLIDPDCDVHRIIIRYVTSSLLPTLITCALMDVFHNAPYSLWLAIVFALGLAGYEMTKEFASFRFVIQIVKAWYNHRRDNDDEVNEVFDDIIQELDNPTEKPKPTVKDNDGVAGDWSPEEVAIERSSTEE